MGSMEDETEEKRAVIKDDYDNPWKEAIEHYFPEFMAFYFPEAYACFDWSQGYTFLEQELRSVIHDAALGKRHMDKMAQMKLNNGEERWIYVHVEIQAGHDSDFARRMFTYNYRIFDKYDRPVGSFAVLADDNQQWCPDHFGYEVGGSRHYLEFPVVKLLRYSDQIDELLISENPFALVTAAHLKTQATRGNNGNRYQAKFTFMRQLLNKGWTRERILPLLRALDGMLRLPDDLDRELWQDIIKQSEGDTGMTYISSLERFAIEKGVLQGRQEGWQEGWQEGRQEGEVLALLRVLKKRFGELPAPLTAQISTASLEEVEHWLDRVIDAHSLDEVFGPSTH
jgi:hypothetical protein